MAKTQKPRDSEVEEEYFDMQPSLRPQTKANVQKFYGNTEPISEYDDYRKICKSAAENASGSKLNVAGSALSSDSAAPSFDDYREKYEGKNE